jgi:hypothetical protein
LGLGLSAAVAVAGPAQRLSRAALLDKIRGGWAGQMIGVSYGAPTEFRSNGKIGDWELTWAPDRVSNAIDQDDLYVEMTFARVMDTIGLKATTAQYGEAFKNSQYDLWHANAAARRALNLGFPAPRSGHPQYNAHANDIDFQIESDFIGLMCPGLPRTANRFCDRVGRVMNYGDGLYGGMFVGGMYAAAYFETDPRRVVEAGLASIPARSGYGRLIRDLLDWSAQYPSDWRRVWQLIEDKWDKNDPCPDGALAPFNIDARLNGAYIAFGLLYGGGDFLKTMEISTRCGQDSDCNPSSAAGVLGVMLGFERIPDLCKSGLAALANKKFAYTEYSFEDIVRSTEKRALELIREAGGTVTDTEVGIRCQTPKAPKLEQWDPGTPDRVVGVADPAWTWDSAWRLDKTTRVCTGAGGRAQFVFEGVGVALMGRLNQDGGCAEVYIDDRKAGVLDAYMVPRTHDNVPWHTYGLKPGRHTLRLVTTGTADSRSKGTTVALDRAVVYRASKAE